MKKQNTRTGLLASTVVGALAGMMVAPAPAVAQDQTAAVEEEEEIVVVGSRIRRDNFNAPSPIQVLTRDESVRAGLASTTEVLQSTAATGFVLGLVRRITQNRRFVLWIAQEFASRETGELAMTGFVELGLDPR